MKTIDLNNNESQVSGVFPNHDGSFTAMTFTRSKTFKTESGAKTGLNETPKKTINFYESVLFWLIHLLNIKGK
ncbi:DUF1391 family protein [Salmonella enterica]|nr:DUF1391 family protein [Salmonella enterica]EJJ4347728.1 DUF1391 family protein [Salmonella enterica]